MHRFMRKTQLESLRKTLTEQKHALLEKVRQKVDTSREEFENEVKDSADVAADYYERELAWGLSETERNRLQEVEDALERMESGSYGICESCGCPIAVPRLTALPFAKLCVECQSKQEKNKQGVPG